MDKYILIDLFISILCYVIIFILWIQHLKSELLTKASYYLICFLIVFSNVFSGIKVNLAAIFLIIATAGFVYYTIIFIHKLKKWLKTIVNFDEFSEFNRLNLELPIQPKKISIDDNKTSIDTESLLITEKLIENMINATATTFHHFYLPIKQATYKANFSMKELIKSENA